MITAKITKAEYDQSIAYHKESFDLVTDVTINGNDVILSFADDDVFNEWYDDYTDATVVIGFDIHGTNEPTEVGLFMERIHDSVFAQVND